MPPTFGNGKICYIEIPATDISRSSEFYGRVFGWNIRKRGDGSTTFDDGADAPEITARFRDPAGNVIGLYQPPQQ
jgi:uncharacterized protein